MSDSAAEERPLRILMHCVYFPPEVGGLESHVYHLARALAADGHDVHVVTSRSQPGLPREETVGGVHVYRTWFPGKSPVGWALHALGSIPLTQRIAREADIVHAQAFASVLPAFAARAVNGAPVVTTWHTSHFLMRAASPLWGAIFRWMLREGDHNLAASREIADVGERLAPGIRVEALTNGVDTELFRRTTAAPTRSADSRFRLIVPRRLFPKNGVEFAVRALPLILSDLDVEMVVVGDGPERRRLETLATSLGVRDRIDFLGSRPHTEMPDVLSSGDLAVIPSLMEATSVAALECMSCELPVAASDVGGLPEIVDDEVGGLFPPADPAGLAERVVSLLRDPRLADRGVAGRRRVVRAWSNARLALRHLEVYRGLLAGRSPANQTSTDARKRRPSVSPD